MAYQEMLAHLAMFSHYDPRRVLVIGGGDGGVIREVCKHLCVETAVLCEIDGDVVDAAKRFFPDMASSLDDPRVNVHIGDGVAFLESAGEGEYDVIIIDSSDPTGPGKKLFTPKFYERVHRALRPRGVVCAQGGNMWLQLDLVRTMVKVHGKPFFSAEYASMQVPTYLGGQIGAFLARKADPDRPDLGASCQIPERRPQGMKLRYYSEEVHHAAFQVPLFVSRQLKRECCARPGERSSEGTPHAPPMQPSPSSMCGYVLRLLGQICQRRELPSR